jgi:hypothetical protein
MITKMKLARVSNPSQLAKVSSGIGKIAINIKTRGSKSQTMEFLIDIEFLRRLKKMRIRRIRAAMETSI